MREFKFNYCIPREYKDKETNEIKYCLCRGGEKMNVDVITNIQKLVKPNLPKDAAPWCQVFNNGYRVTKDNLNWEEWTGFTFADVDSKYYYNFEKRFNEKTLLKGIIDNGPFLYNYNFYAVHLTNSGTSYRIFWYWDCTKTEDNFKKCCILTEQYTRKLFYSLGSDAKKIIDYEVNGHRVLDRCSKSIMQGFYITKNEIHFSSFIDNESFGYIELDDIELEEIYQTNNIQPMNNGCMQHDEVEYEKTKPVNKDSLRYYPHQHRRCIYEALIVLFDNKDKVDEEWKKVCDYLPETDGIEAGHNKQFYLNEPNKNNWYIKFNKEVKHDLSWLRPFGYVFKDKSEYVYIEQFKKSWKKHIWWMIFLLFFKKKLRELNQEMKKDEEDKYKESLYEEFSKYNIFGNKLEEEFKDHEDLLEQLQNYRKEYYKTKWTNKEFKHLCNGYDIPKDIVTYKMYADFYYRDENGEPIIKYDILEDDIKVLGYWPETNKVQYHTFKYNDEYTHWKNNDTFCNSCNNTDLMKAVNKYVPRWHNYHTLKNYLNNLDLSKYNEGLLETWAIRYFKADDTILTREICKKFFIAAVKKQMIEDPTSFVFQHMLFLQGPTGCGKTFFLTNMFTIDGHSYILNKIDPNGKDNEIGPLIAKNWMIQFGESENLKKISVNAAKEFIDRINLGMKYQKKYENEQTTIYPRIMACRTSNDDVLFNDISISEGDRRNWLIICNNGVNGCDENLRKLMKEEKDILWATAYKLYLDNPEQDLELSSSCFNELAELQEEYKMIKTSDIEEIYNDVFNRIYLTNNKNEIRDEYSFNKMLERSDSHLEENDAYYTDLLDDKYFVQHNRISRIPGRWLSEWVKKKYGANYMKLLKKYMIDHGWEFKTAGYLNGTYKCFVKEKEPK